MAARVSNKMKSFAGRTRLRLDHFQVAEPEAAHRVETARQQMRKVLGKKNITGPAAEWTIQQALDAAIDYQLQALRSEQEDQQHARAKEHLRRLMVHIGRLSEAIKKLPPVSKGKLNRLIAENEWTEFDTEMFEQLFHELLEALSQLSPARFANDARLEIRESLDFRSDPIMTRYDRSGPPIVIELWQCIPAATRAAAEAELREWAPPTRGQVIAFLEQLNWLFDKHWPKPRRGRRRALVGAYLSKIAAIWRRLDLRVGVARGGSIDRVVESSIQQFARIALAGIGDNSVISIRQIVNLKSEKRPRTQ